MGKMIGRGLQTILLLFYNAKVSHYRGNKDLRFSYIKFDITLIGLKIPT